jgi:phosphatidate cytidylyltransferase
MKRVLTAAVLVPLVLVLVFLGPRGEWLFTFATAAVAVLAAWEFLGLAERIGAQPPRGPVMAAVLLLFVVRLFAESFEPFRQVEIVFAMAALGLLIVCVFRSPVERVFLDASVAVFCLFYIGFTLSVLPALHEEAEGNGASLVTFLLFAVWSGDIAALYVGRAWGRHKLAPTLSPNKSWEGAVASVAGSLLATVGLLALSIQLADWNIEKLTYHNEGWAYWLVLAVVVNVAAQVGDLTESALKRAAGVKDSGSLLPGHGGVLDRIDALLLAAPVLWYAQIVHQRF